MAEPFCGDIKSVLFQYKPVSGDGWINIPPAEPNHPNPDLSAPYFVHWDVSNLPDGNYSLRAVASDGTNSDPSPPFITITVSKEYPNVEGKISGDELEVKNEILTDVSNELLIGHPRRDAVEGIKIPAGAIDKYVSVIGYKFLKSVPSLPSGLKDIGEYREVSADSPLSGEIEMRVCYKDDDNDGFVDSPVTGEHYLALYRYDNGSWVRLDSRVDADGNCITGKTNHLSTFGLFATYPRQGIKLSFGCEYADLKIASGGSIALIIVLLVIGIRRNRKKR